MDYVTWREEIFGQPDGADPVWVDISPELDDLSADSQLNFIVRAMSDPAIHDRFTIGQIGIGIQLIYDNNCSNIAFSYLHAKDEGARVAGVQAIGALYRNFFARYCRKVVVAIGDADCCANAIGYMCYMFWDLFPFKPDRMTAPMTAAALCVMQDALQSGIEQCQASALHGLGHRVRQSPQANAIIADFITAQTDRSSPAILSYARQAATGCIQ